VHCDVVIVGYRLNAKEPAAKALERILGVTPEAARALTRAFPSVVAENAPEAHAEQLREQLTSAGALVELRPRGALNVAAARPDVPGAGAAAPAAAAGPAEAKVAPPAAPPRARLPVADFSLDLELPSIPAPERGPTIPRSTAGLQLPPPGVPQAASPGLPAPVSKVPTASAANYQLGDFGLAGPRGPSMSGLLPISGGSVVAALPTAPPSVPPAPNPSAGGAMDLDLELGGGLELELDHSDQAGSGLRRGLSDHPPDNDHHSLGERFEELAGGAAEAPARDTRPRPPVRAPRPLETRRSLPPQVPKVEASALHGALREWVPSLLLLAAISAGSLAAVGYALDPSDVLGALQRERTAVSTTSAPPMRSEGPGGPDAMLGLHPLLRATPAITRGPLAAILRARIGGVHEVPVSFAKQGATVHCSLVEHAEGGETEVRLARLRETGREVPAPSDITAQLREHERALRTASHHPELRFTQVCLAL